MFSRSDTSSFTVETFSSSVTYNINTVTWLFGFSTFQTTLFSLLFKDLKDTCTPKIVCFTEEWGGFSVELWSPVIKLMISCHNVYWMCFSYIFDEERKSWGPTNVKISVLVIAWRLKCTKSIPVHVQNNPYNALIDKGVHVFISKQA